MRLEIILHGVTKAVTVQELFDLAAKGVINPQTPININGTLGTAGTVKGIVFVTPSRNNTYEIIPAPKMEIPSTACSLPTHGKKAMPLFKKFVSAIITIFALFFALIIIGAFIGGFITAVEQYNINKEKRQAEQRMQEGKIMAEQSKKEQERNEEKRVLEIANEEERRAQVKAEAEILAKEIAKEMVKTMPTPASLSTQTQCGYCFGHGRRGDCFDCKGRGYRIDGSACNSCDSTGQRLCNLCNGRGMR